MMAFTEEKVAAMDVVCISYSFCRENKRNPILKGQNSNLPCWKILSSVTQNGIKIGNFPDHSYRKCNIYRKKIQHERPSLKTVFVIRNIFSGNRTCQIGTAA